MTGTHVPFKLEIAKIALKSANLDKHTQSTTKPNRLKDLPNLRLATERMLKKAGIESVETLEKTGAVDAFKAIQLTHSSDLNIELLWALEGAINGTHWSVVPQNRRRTPRSNSINTTLQKSVLLTFFVFFEISSHSLCLSYSSSMCSNRERVFNE